MSVVTLRIPDEKHARLKQLASSRSTSVNRLLDDLATIALTQHDLAVQFELMAKEGYPALGLKLLDELDAHFAKPAAKQ